MFITITYILYFTLYNIALFLSSSLDILRKVWYSDNIKQRKVKMKKEELTVNEIKEFATYVRYSSCYKCALINNTDCDVVDCRKCKYRDVKNRRCMK